MNHDDIKILISAYADGETTPEERNIVEEHLKACTSCQQDLKAYKNISSSLSKWPNENLSPDEEIKMQKRIEQRREPMFTKRTLMTLGTTLALSIIIASVVQVQIKKENQGRLRSASDDLGEQFSPNNTLQVAGSIAAQQPRTQYAPYYLKSLAVRSGMVASEMSAPQVTAETFAIGSQMTPRISSQSFRGSYTNPPVNYNSKLKNTATVGIFVQDAGKAQVQLENIITSFKGIIVNSQFNKSTEQSSLPNSTSSLWTYTSSGAVVFTVLPEHLRKVFLEVRKLGDVLWENQYGEDVTEQYLESQKRLENDQNIMDRFRKILEKKIHSADGVEKIDNVQEIAQQLESLQTVIEEDKLALTQTDMATLTVRYYEKSNNLLQGLGNKGMLILRHSYEAFINTFSGIIVLFSSLLPSVLILTFILWGAYRLIRKYFK